jgi:cell shape-determining protein MreC
MLWGTGRREREGSFLPFLEVRHLSPLGQLEPETAVFTAGGDGVYPPGFLIGHVLAEESEIPGAYQLVKAAVRPDELREAVVIVDRARRAWQGLEAARK